VSLTSTAPMSVGDHHRAGTAFVNTPTGPG
jgi:hypothetical protein